jgi:hypothetical protein
MHENKSRQLAFTTYEFSTPKLSYNSLPHYISSSLTPLHKSKTWHRIRQVRSQRNNILSAALLLWFGFTLSILRVSPLFRRPLFRYSFPLPHPFRSYCVLYWYRTLSQCSFCKWDLHCVLHFSADSTTSATSICSLIVSLHIWSFTAYSSCDLWFQIFV